MIVWEDIKTLDRDQLIARFRKMDRLVLLEHAKELKFSVKDNDSRPVLAERLADFYSMKNVYEMMKNRYK